MVTFARRILANAHSGHSDGSLQTRTAVTQGSPGQCVRRVPARAKSVLDVSCIVPSLAIDYSRLAASTKPTRLFLSFPNRFTVIGPAEPILVKPSEDVLLPCHLSPKMSAEHMEVSWFRSHFSDAVYVYWDGKAQDEEQAVEYRGRTQLVKDTIAEGDVTLRIQSVRLSDNGQYWCRFQENHEYGEATSEVVVTSLGTVPHIRMEGPVDQRIQLVCISRGWFPEPQARWRYVGGDEPLPSKIQILVIDGLFRVEMSLMIREDSSVKNVSCSIYNPILDEEKVSFVYIPALRKVVAPTQSIVASVGEDALLTCHLFPEVNAQSMEVGWIRSQFSDTVYMYRDGKDQEEEQMVEYRRRTEFTKDAITKGSVALKIRNIRVSDDGQYQCYFEKNRVFQRATLKIKVEVDPQEEIERRKVLYRAEWRKALIYADWRKEYFQAVHVTLDPDTAHPELILSEEWRRVIRGESPQDFPDTAQRFDVLPCVLGREKIISGRHYWEVEVGNRGDWELGVCRENVQKKGEVIVSSESGFWALRLYDDKYWALSNPPTCLSLRQSPQTVAIFVDYDFGDVSFYNMNDGSHIYNFTSQFFFGALCPYIRLWSCDQAPVTICPEP
ncbi:LOW QUALITY PROTEIN: butyrophilin-like protein 2 [Trichosurus vulpecula]|uniref:LOW QUALITY PROTEIN: butyrophilin-like protein 2 n=1 Tax=Trichosurus vulpecula TaxID=9337 RepID=UPI00186B1964|nr:LOW QUALITY PROTEIN: butyrophilin-like protein 2 [Trichosurus vulpecula]